MPTLLAMFGSAPRCDEQHRDVELAVDRRDEQRRRVVDAAGVVDVGAAVEQRARGFDVALTGRVVQRRHSADATDGSV